MSHSSSHSRGRKLDGLFYSNVCHASANTSGHDRVDVTIGGIGIVSQQRRCLHDLSRLAIAALRNLQLKPRGLERMLALGIEPLDGGHLGSRDCAYRSDTGSRGAPLDMNSAGAAETNPAAEFGSSQA